MAKGNPRQGFCLCEGPVTIRDTKAADGRLHFSCHDLTPEGKAKHYGFVDASEAWRTETPWVGSPKDASRYPDVSDEVAMGKGNPRMGFCLCGGPGIIRDTKASDGRLHFICGWKTPEGKASHYGFVDRSESRQLEEGPPDFWEDDEELDGLEFEHEPDVDSSLLQR